MALSSINQIVLVLCVGAAAQYLAHLLRFPSIILFLSGGILVGPVLQLLQPDALVGQLLQPLISLSVALVLFEGGLSLRFKDIPQIGRSVVGLLSVGTLVCWAGLTLAATHFFQLDIGVALLIGAIGTVSGPTVIPPLLRHIRPRSPLGEILQWEAILIDPVGVLIAVLVFELLSSGATASAPLQVALGIFGSAFTGLVVGFVIGKILTILFARFLIPDRLQSGIVLAAVVVAYALSNAFFHESGLVAVIVLGMLLRNSSNGLMSPVRAFFENLTDLLVPGLFTLIAARIEVDEVLAVLTVEGVLFLVLAIVVIRPVSVLAATIGTGLRLKERLFLGSIAPRGIVAASLSSILALELEHVDIPGVQKMLPVVFLLIIGTVILYSFISPFAASLLGVRQAPPRGLLFIGASGFARILARTLGQLNVQTMLLDSNYWNVSQAKSEGMKCFFGNAISEETRELLDLDGISKLVAFTSNDELNTLAVTEFREVFASADVYQLSPYQGGHSKHQASVRGRLLSVTFKKLEERLRVEGDISVMTAGVEELPSDAIPLFSVDEKGNVAVGSVDRPLEPKPGDKIIFIRDGNA